MARILVVSSFVTSGHVGMVTNVAALQALGHDVVQLPTIVLSNHPGLPHVAGEKVDSDLLLKMLEALNANGLLDNITAILTGYLPTESHVAVAREAVRLVRQKNEAAVFVCDPIVGDDPEGLYLPQPAAVAIRDQLVPLADILTPNRFELSWFSGCRVESLEDVQLAAEALPCKGLAATSIPMGSNEILNVLIQGGTALPLSTMRRADMPHGTGDLFCGLLTGLIAMGRPLPDAFAQAHHYLTDVVALSSGRTDLELAPLRNIT